LHTINDAGDLTVRELLEHSGLGLTAATGEVGLGRVVRGIHFSDADDPVQYLTSESVLIVSGRTWYQDVSVGLYQLDRLASIDTAALVVALGHFVDEIPAEMVARARELRLPVLLLPAGALTRTVLSYVYHALASADLHRLRRTVAMQNDLLDLLIAEAGVDELLAKVSLLIGMPMLLLDGTGTLVTSMGEVDPHRRARPEHRTVHRLHHRLARGRRRLPPDPARLCRRRAGRWHRGRHHPDRGRRLQRHGRAVAAQRRAAARFAAVGQGP